MEQNPSLLFRLLLASFLFGVVLGGFYDLLRISRVLLGINRYTDAASAPAFCPRFCKPSREKKLRPAGRVLQNGILVVQDVLFCLVAGMLIAILLFSQNNGEFRWFVPVGLAIGFASYYFTVGKLVITASEYIVFALKTAFLYLIYYVTLPLILLGRLLLGQMGRISRFFKEKKIAKYDKAVRERLLAGARRGFLDEGWQENQNSQ